MVMAPRVVSARRFETQCLALLDEVAATGDQIIVTKGGRPIAQLVPFIEPTGLRGSVTFHVADDELVAPSDER